jgi:hypothetical protein
MEAETVCIEMEWIWICGSLFVGLVNDGLEMEVVLMKAVMNLKSFGEIVWFRW